MACSNKITLNRVKFTQMIKTEDKVVIFCLSKNVIVFSCLFLNNDLHGTERSWGGLMAVSLNDADPGPFSRMSYIVLQSPSRVIPESRTRRNPWAQPRVVPKAQATSAKINIMKNIHASARVSGLPTPSNGLTCALLSRTWYISPFPTNWPANLSSMCWHLLWNIP